MAFEILNHAQVTPPRLYAMVRLVPLLRDPSRKELFDLVQPTTALPRLENQNAASNVFAAARSCGLLVENEEGVVRLLVPAEAVETLAAFRRYMQDRLLGITDDNADNYLLNIYTAWYAAQDDRVFKLDPKDFEVLFNSEMFPESEARHFNTTKIRGWRIWAAFLGVGWPMSFGSRDLVVPDARNRLEPLLGRLLPAGESTIVFSSFMEQLAEHCPELDGGSLFRRCVQASRPDQLGNGLSLMLSNALRVLHQADKIHLSLQPDAPTKWMLYPAVGHSLGLVSHIQCGRAA